MNKKLSKILEEKVKVDWELKQYYYTMSSSLELVTLKDYIDIIIRFKAKYNKPLKKIREVEISEYLYELNQNGASDSQKALTWSAFNSFYTYMQTKDKCKNPMLTIPRPKVKTEFKPVAMNREEINIVLENIKKGVGDKYSVGRQEPWKNRDMTIILLFLFTGMRLTALTQINIEDLSEDLRKLKIVDKRRVAHEYTLPDIVVESLEQWLRDRKRVLQKKRCNALFVSRLKQRITQNSVRDLVKKYTEGIDKNITPHKFRSTYITALYEQTKDIYFVQQAVKHSSVATTQRYILNNGETSEKSNKCMNNFIKREENMEGE